MRNALLALGLLASPAAAEATLAEASLGLELVPCALSDLSCVTLSLPLDPRANDPEKTIDITFALSFAHVESRGILFYVVGGPGGSGLASAEGYLSAFNPSLTDYMDIVFIDAGPSELSFWKDTVGARQVGDLIAAWGARRLPVYPTPPSAVSNSTIERPRCTIRASASRSCASPPAAGSGTTRSPPTCSMNTTPDRRDTPRPWPVSQGSRSGKSAF